MIAKCFVSALWASAVLVGGAVAQTGAMSGPVPTPAELHAAATPTHDETWWKHAVVYEIYPRSFQDSNGDGVGDLNGITQRLDYLQGLGVDAVWIAPMFPSPQVDFGYDVSDFVQVDPQYGTVADMDRLIAEAKKRNIRICLDWVVNHTSDKHKWFEESAASRTNAKADWYVWSDGKKATDPAVGRTRRSLSTTGWFHRTTGRACLAGARGRGCRRGSSFTITSFMCSSRT